MAQWSPREIASASARRNRKIISARLGGVVVGKVPPFAEVTGKAVPAHHRTQQVAPLALVGGNCSALAIAFDVEAVITGAHIDAVVRRALRGRAGAGSIARGRIEAGDRRGWQSDERQIDSRSGRVP